MGTENNLTAISVICSNINLGIHAQKRFAVFMLRMTKNETMRGLCKRMIDFVFDVWAPLPGAVGAECRTTSQRTETADSVPAVAVVAMQLGSFMNCLICEESE